MFLLGWMSQHRVMDGEPSLDLFFALSRPANLTLSNRGENSNYGLVHLDDDPYVTLTSMFTSLHGIVYGLHEQGNR